MKTNTKEQAIDAYIRKVAHIDAMLRRICDSVFKEGEHALENNA